MSSYVDHKEVNPKSEFASRKYSIMDLTETEIEIVSAGLQNVITGLQNLKSIDFNNLNQMKAAVRLSNMINQAVK